MSDTAVTKKRGRPAKAATENNVSINNCIRRLPISKTVLSHSPLYACILRKQTAKDAKKKKLPEKKDKSEEESSGPTRGRGRPKGTSKPKKKVSIDHENNHKHLKCSCDVKMTSS